MGAAPPGISRAPGVPSPPFPRACGPVSEGCGVGGGALPRGSGLGLVSAALGCWGCGYVGARARSGRSRWALHPVQGNPGACSGRPCCVGSRPFLAKHLFVWFCPLISLKRMGRAAHYLAPRPFTVRTDPGATALNARFWFHLTPKHVAITSVVRGSKRGFLKTGSLPRALLAALGDAAPQPVTREASPLRSVSDNHGATCVCAGSGWFEQRPC